MPRTLLAILLGLIVSLRSQGGDERLLSREEAVRMLPYSIEGNAPGEYEAFLRLVEIGGPAYPALIEELLDEGGSTKVSSIIGVFESSKGDKTAPLQAMKRFVERHGRKSPPFHGIKAVISGIGQLGGEKEKEFLKSYLDLEEGLVRHTVEDSIKLIEKRQEAVKREATSRERREHAQATPDPLHGTDAANPIASSFKITKPPMGIAILLIATILAALGFFLSKKQ